MNFFLVIGLTILTQSLFAMNPDTPGEVASFVTLSDIKERVMAAKEHHVEFAGRPWEQLAPEEKRSILKSIGQDKDVNDEKLDEVINLIDVTLPQLTALVTSKRELLDKVFYGCRRFLPEACRGITFEEITPFDFSVDTKKVLAVGGTSEEIQLLSHEPYNLVASSICAINVLRENGIHYIADMNSPEHMDKFKKQFDFAFVSAVPFGADKVESEFNNIASSLNDNGFFVGYASSFKAIEDPALLLLQNGFASAKTIYRSLDGAAWFIASKVVCDDLENAVTASPIGKSLYNYVVMDRDFHKEQDLQRK
jgi:hypothetical protein